MPLYNNILSSRRNESDSGANAATKTKSGSPSASMKLLQDHLQSKRRAQQQLKANRGVKPIDSCKDNKNETRRPSQDCDYWNHDEEYDPMVPNSYELVKAEHLKSEKRRLAKLMSSAGKKLSVPHLLDVIDKLDEYDDDDDDDDNDKTNRGTAIAPPPSLGNANKSIGHHTLESINSRDRADVKPCAVDESAPTRKHLNEGPSSIAAKIMSKMGYRQGQGLGKGEQGISEPLEVEKSGPNLGRISLPVVSQPQPQPKPLPQRPPTSSMIDDGASTMGDATRVLLLQNMVGPGEVDDDLESETKEECKKYGSVVRCLIYEIPNKRVPDEQAVRIFVEFEHAKSALKAANDLNGRYFGGRIVRASFYNVEKFNKYELGLPVQLDS